MDIIKMILWYVLIALAAIHALFICTFIIYAIPVITYFFIKDLIKEIRERKFDGDAYKNYLKQRMKDM